MRRLVAHAADVTAAVLENVGCVVRAFQGIANACVLRVCRVGHVVGSFVPHVLYFGKQSIVAKIEQFVVDV